MSGTIPSEPAVALMAVHGDTAVHPGMVDFAVNVRGTAPPDFLAEILRASLTDLAAYPTVADVEAATVAVAASHERPADQVLLLAGVAEGFALLERLAPRHAAVIHPSFTEPDLALRAAGIPVTRVVLDEPWLLDPATVPEDADLVVLGNPTNPTGVLHPAVDIESLRRPGRVVVVDEAFMDAVGAGASQATLAARTDLPDVLVFRSLTKTFALAGLRCGYALGHPGLLARLAARRPPWPVGTLQLRAIAACHGPTAAAWVVDEIARIDAERATMTDRLRAAGWVPRPSTAPFLLAEPPGGDAAATRLRAAAAGVAVRRCDTFPGLDGTRLLRLAVRETGQVLALLEATAP